MSFFRRFPGVCRTCRWVVVVAALILPAGSARGSFVINQTDAAGDFDAAVRVLTAGGSGTGTLIGRHENQNNLYLCLVTADHVVAGGGLNAIGFRGRGQADTFNILPSSSAIFHGGPTLKEDMAFVGVTIDKSTLTANQLSLLRGIGDSFNPVGLAVAPANTGFNFLENGYGRSATPDPNFMIGGNSFAFVYHSNAALFPDEQYGIERFFDNTVTKYSVFADATYTYNAESWFLRDAAGGAIAGEGQGNSGDSGAALLVGGNIQGLLTNVWGDNMRNLFVNGAGDEGFKIGSEGLGIAFTQADVNWLMARDEAYCAPEPASWLLAMLGVASAYGGRRLVRRKRDRTDVDLSDDSG